MSELRKRASEAKAYLGRTGAVRRVAAVASLYQGDATAEDWVVETFDSKGSGGRFLTIFSGPLARERAVEYAREKYSGLRLRGMRRR